MDPEPSILSFNVDVLDIPTHAKKALCAANIKTLRDLVAKTSDELLAIYGMGYSGVYATMDALYDMGLYLAQDPPIPIKPKLVDAMVALKRLDPEVGSYNSCWNQAIDQCIRLAKEHGL